MTGVVLCGGQSTRMGADKGLLKRNDISWAQITADKLSSLNIPFVVSINHEQSKSYAALFEEEMIIIDDQKLIVRGPLLGVLSVHQKFLSEDIFVLACDMQEIKHELLQKLIDHYTQGTNEAYVYATGKLQPLCGIYTCTGLNKIRELYCRQELKKFSMMHVLESIDAKYIKVDKNFFHYFNNYNNPEDVIEL